MAHASQYATNILNTISDGVMEASTPASASVTAQNHNHFRRGRQELYFAVIAMVIINTINAAFMIQALSVRAPSPEIMSPPSRTRLYCGNSTSEVEAAGCGFDPLTATKLPKVCSHDGAEDFFQSYGPGNS